MIEQAELFIDTVYLLASFDPEDQWRQAAEDTEEIAGSRLLVTTDGVFSEFLAHVSRYGPGERLRAVEHINNLKETPAVEVVELTSQLVNAAISAYGGEFRYTRLSLQDCISILVMRERGITEALTADREFTLAGIEVLMHAPAARG